LNSKEGDKKYSFQILAECKGADLVGILYELMKLASRPYENVENAFRSPV
jgi:isoleucyl-tRNA synthetase